MIRFLWKHSKKCGGGASASRLSSILAGCILLTLTASASAGREEQAVCVTSEQNGGWKIRCTNGTLKKLAGSIKKAAGVDILFATELGSVPVSVSIDATTLDAALESALSQFNWVAMSFEDAASGTAISVIDTRETTAQSSQSVVRQSDARGRKNALPAEIDVGAVNMVEPGIDAGRHVNLGGDTPSVLAEDGAPSVSAGPSVPAFPAMHETEAVAFIESLQSTVAGGLAGSSGFSPEVPRAAFLGSEGPPIDSTLSSVSVPLPDGSIQSDPRSTQ